MIAPMEHPVAGYSNHPREVRRLAPLVHGGTSLRLSEGSESPLLEAHPGSPVDLTGRRPSLNPSMASIAAQRLYHGTEEEFSKFERSTKPVGRRENVTRDGMAAKGYHSGVNGAERELQKTLKRRGMGLQPFYIPAKVMEQDEVQVHHVLALGDSKLPADTSVETTAMDLDFEGDTGVWVTAHPMGHESRTSLATTTTAASTLMDDRFSRALTLDTSVASSAASMMSMATSIQSATTTTSSDIYGWEEELDRKTDIEGHNAWERDLARRLPSGGRTVGPRRPGGLHDYQYNKQGTGRRKSLLYRVLNLSGSRERKSSAGNIAETGSVTTSPANEYPTSATT